MEHINPLKCKAWRVVEDQSRSSTRELVDSLEEHEILEDLIEKKGKPALPYEPEFKGLHFLLATPFRYPPLLYGSRFGRRFERSLWYGAKEIETALGESAFYRFLFFAGTEANLLPCRTSHSVYAIDILTQQGVILERGPFEKYSSLISQKETYHYSQPLGSAMREAGVQGFSYFSARLEGQVNIGIFTPLAFVSKSVDFIQHWKCYTDHNNVEFTREHLLNKKVNFYKEHFLVNNVLPFDSEIN